MGLSHATFRQDVRKNKSLIKSLAELLSDEIQDRGDERPRNLDFRFLLPLAQWLVEQDGYTMTPQGNNPGNVMGSGDLGTFRRQKNHEFEGGKRVLKPADFASFSSMEVGTKATFDRIESNWPRAMDVILSGGSPELYVQGLQGRTYGNYATTPAAAYLSAIRFRLKNIILDYTAVLEDDIKEICQLNALRSASLPFDDGITAARDRAGPSRSVSCALGDDRMRVGDRLDRFESGSANAVRGFDAARSLAMSLDEQNRVATFDTEASLRELKEVERRLQDKKALQPDTP